MDKLFIYKSSLSTSNELSINFTGYPPKVFGIFRLPEEPTYAVTVALLLFTIYLKPLSIADTFFLLSAFFDFSVLLLSDWTDLFSFMILLS